MRPRRRRLRRVRLRLSLLISVPRWRLIRGIDALDFRGPLEEHLALLAQWLVVPGAQINHPVHRMFLVKRADSIIKQLLLLDVIIFSL